MQKMVVIKVTPHEHAVTQWYAQRLERGVGPLVRDVPLHRLIARAEKLKAKWKADLSAQAKSALLAAEQRWLADWVERTGKQ